MFNKASKVIILILLVALLAPAATAVFAQNNVACEENYTVQANDWLSKLADKFYGDGMAYPAIFEATNAIAKTDKAYAVIANADLIEIGQQLCIPSQADAQTLLKAAGTAVATAEQAVAMPQPGAGGSSFSVEPNYKDLAYAPVSASQKLNLYLPTTGTGPFPVVINIHGGGFKFGDKGMLNEITGKALLKAGYAVASIDYRLSGEAQFPAAVQDAKAVVRFLRANAAQYNLNPDKMAVFGQSAGGNIASMVGVTGNSSDFDDASLGNAGVSSKVQAVIDWFGPTDFLQMDAQAKAQGCAAADQAHNDAGSFESAYIGAAIQTAPDQVKKSNPITYISQDTPPFLIQKGDQDCTVPIENTKMLADALSAAKLDVTYTSIVGAGHGGDQFETDENVALVISFLDKYLKSSTAAQTTATAKNKPIKSVTAITEVFGEGQKVTAVAVEYDQAIDNSKLSKSAFSVDGRTITNVYANTAAAKAAPGANGNYVIIELSTDDANASTLGHSGVGPASRTIRSEVKLSVTQLGDITTTNGEKYAATSQAVVNDKEINLVVDDFQQLEYKDPKTGITLKYNLYVPKNYDKNKSYPLVMFIHDAGTVSDDPQITLVQGLGAVVWATPSEQAKHESFVLAPQYASATVNDNSEATQELDITVDLINSLTSQYLSLELERIERTKN